METPEDTNPGLRESRSRSLYLKVVTAFAGLLFISLCCVVFYNQRSNSRIVLKLSNALMDRAAETVLEKSKSYLQPAAVMAEISARTVQEGSLPFGDQTRLELFGIEVLRAYRQMTMRLSRRIERPVVLLTEEANRIRDFHLEGEVTIHSQIHEIELWSPAIAFDSKESLGHQIVTMLDVAIRGVGSKWDDVIIPGLDFVVIENTLGKFGKRVEDFNAVPRYVQPLVGRTE